MKKYFTDTEIAKFLYPVADEANLPAGEAGSARAKASAYVPSLLLLTLCMTLTGCSTRKQNVLNEEEKEKLKDEIVKEVSLSGAGGGEIEAETLESLKKNIPGEYHDAQYNFTIKYPEKWEIENLKDGYNKEKAYIIVFDRLDKNENDPLPFISIRKDWTFDDEIDRINKLDPPYTKVTEVTDTEVAGSFAKKIVFATTSGINLQRIFLMRENQAFMFESKENDKDFQKVIKSFSFEK